MQENELKAHVAEMLGYDPGDVDVALVTRADEAKVKVTHKLAGTVHFVNPPAGLTAAASEEEGDGETAEMALTEMSSKELKAKAKSMGLKGYSKLSVLDLIAMIEEADGEANEDA